MTVDLLPTLVAGSPASSTICEGGSQTLTASGFASSGVLDTLDFQNFTSTQYVSSGSNTGGGNAFVTTSSPYIGNSGLIQITNNVDASNFTIAIASNFAGGSSSTTSQLTSPILDNSAYTELSLIFNHSFVRSTGNTATVEVSTNGGTSWTPVKSYTTNQGNNTTFVRDSISLNAYLASTNFRIRFNTSLSVTGGGGARWWAIDNVLLKGLAPVQPLYAWTANTASGVNGLPSGSGVYSEANTSISVSPTTTTEYTVTAQDRVSGCTTEATPITVTVNPSPAAASVEGGERCGTGKVLLSATVDEDETADWYSVPTGGSPLTSGSLVFLTPNISTTTTYYVATRNLTAGCVSLTRVPVTATVHPLPLAAVAVNGDRCNAGRVNIATVVNSGETADWYAAPTGGLPLLSGSISYNTPVISTTTNYYVVARNLTTGCLSATRTLVRAIVNNPTTSAVNITACDAYTWFGTTYTATGTYTYTTTNSIGCDSIITLNLTINTSNNSSTNVTACDSYTWNGTTYTASGTYTFNTSTVLGCDSVATLNLTIRRSTISSASVTACDSYTWNGNTYTASGTYTFSATNSVDCDSTASLILTINNSTTSSTNITACDSYLWNGTTYTASGTYTFNTTNAKGCDSTATLILTINTSNNSSTDVTACDSYLWNGTTYTASGTYTFNTNTVLGCDSVATLNLTIKNSTTSSVSVTACDSYTWNGNTYTASGTYTFSATNSVDCDSTASLILTINNSTTSSTNITACDSYDWNGTTYTASGTYTFNTTNAVNCDSTATLILTINTSNNSSTDVTACDSYLWNGTTYTASGTYTFNTNTVLGCDSVATLNLTITNSTSSSFSITACDSYDWNGNTYTASGTYTFNTTNSVDCDSTATLILTIDQTPTSAISGSGTVCPQSSITLTHPISGGVWSSNDLSIAVVNAQTGEVTGVSAGNTDIVYTVSNGICTATITHSLEVLTNTSASIGGSSMLCAESTNLLTRDAEGGIWASSDINVVTVNDSGLVTGIAQGTAYITHQITDAVTGCITRDTFDIQINPIPVGPDTIFGLVELCNYVNTTDTLTYSTDNIPGINDYQWSVPTGLTIVSGQGSTSIKVVVDSNMARAGSRIYVSSVNSFGCTSAPASIVIYKTAPFIFTLTGTRDACPLMGLDTTTTYTCNERPTASSYLWEVPSGASIVSGQGSTSIQVSYDTSFTSGTIKVTGLSNCGVRAPMSINITRNLPNLPGFVSGPSSACEYYNNGNLAGYKIAPVNFATGYIWTLPPNMTLINGQGTDSITVRFEDGFVNSTLKVRSMNNCFTSIDRNMNITANPYPVPAAIFGPSNACFYMNTANTATYFINKVPNAQAYIWTVPQGVEIVSNPGGFGQNDTMIEVRFDTSFVGGSRIQVQTTGCNTSAARTMIVNANVQMTPTAVFGTSGVCSQIIDGTPVAYTTSSMSNVNAYMWNVPEGATLVSGQGDTSVQVVFDSTFIGGSITVQTSTWCGLSLPGSLNVSKLSPVAPRLISGANAIFNCSPLNNTEYTYTAVGANRADVYNWSVPANISVTARLDDSTLKVMVDTSFTQGAISVSCSNACGVSAERTLTITKKLPAVPTSIIGATNVCNAIGNGNTLTYRTQSVANAISYLWTVPAGATIVSGQGDTAITIRLDSSFINGNLRVQSMGYCGVNTFQRSLSLTRATVSAPASISGPNSSCAFYANDSVATYSIAAVSGATGYVWTLPANTRLISGQGTTSIRVKFDSGYVSSAIKVKAVNDCSSSNDRSLTVGTSSPTAPGNITGSTNACIYINDAFTPYSIRKVAGATGYIWTVPAGVEIVSHPGGTGANDTVIVVNFTTDFVFGTSIQVRSVGCGISAARSLVIRGSVSTTPGTITGPTNACEFEVSPNRPNGILATYTIRKVSSASFYTWEVPAGAEIISHPGGTDDNDTIILVKFADEFNSGQIKVRSHNSCGNSSFRTLSIITRQASTPGAITATQTGICPNRVYRYSIASMPAYATSIQWTVPDQATILSQSGLTITVAYPSTTIGGTVTVKGINNCSISSARSLTIRLNACPVSFTGGGTGGTQIKGNVELEEAQPARAIEADVYPNPTTSTFRVRLNSSSSSAVFIRIYDMQGRMLIQKNIKANEIHQIGQELRAGSYILEIIQDDQKLNQKLIKF
jgi:hypothetical protein